MKLDELQVHQRNARKHPRKNLEAIKASWERFGQTKPLVAHRFARDRVRSVIAGNGGLMVARELGWREVAVLPFRGTDEEAEAYAIADNRSGELSSWERSVVETQAAAMRARADLATLYDRLNLQALIGARTSRSADEDTPELPKKATIKRGEIWRLGAHRLMCGDSFDAGDRGRLLAGELCACALMDPPYAIYGSATGISPDIADDKMVRPFFDSLCRAVGESVAWFAHVYVHTDWRSWASLWEGARSAGLAAKNCLVWDKGGGGLGANYWNTHEFVGFFAKVPAQDAIGRKATGQRAVHKPNILRYPRSSGDDRHHNAAKPIAMLEELLENSTDSGQLVLDLFGGSGSTLIACEKAGRRCLTMEIEPRWCDVIVERWQTATGQRAALLEGPPA